MLLKCSILCLAIVVVPCLIVLVSGQAVGPRPGPVEFETTSLVVQERSDTNLVFTVEVARTRRQLATGLMYRTHMDPTHGMIFLLGRTQPVRMWMKNTALSLDMLFIDENGIIVGVTSNTRPFSEDIIIPRQKAKYVVEFVGGTVNKLGIHPGDHIVTSAIQP